MRKGTSKWDGATDDTLKRCSRCGIEKPVRSGFYWYSKHAGPPRPLAWCKACNIEQATAWQKANPERAFLNAQRSYDKTLYGLPPGSRQALYDKQGGVCAICKRPPRQKNRGGKGSRGLHLDHDHKTGKTRGLLCHHCNTALGQFDHDPELLRAALRYLRKYA